MRRREEQFVQYSKLFLAIIGLAIIGKGFLAIIEALNKIIELL
ncbi:MAG: hypothetical protein AABY22_06335 [Nanoarchaeota archaeon]